MPNYVQPFTANPLPTGATVQIESVKNVLNISGPQTVYTQAGTVAPPLLTNQLRGTWLGAGKHTYPNGTSVFL